MLPGTITSEDVREYESTVTVNGVERAHEAWQISRKLTGDLPKAVASVGAVTQASGSITWASSQEPDVSEYPANPFNASTGWTPQPGDRVQIFVTIDGVSYPRFTGKIDIPAGSLTGGMTSTIVDDIDNLNEEYSQPSIWDKMPSGSPVAPRNIKCGPMHTLISAANAAGYYNRRKPVGTAGVFALMQSGSWPTEGDMILSQDGQETGGFPTFHDTGDNGWVVSDVYAEYSVAAGANPQPGNFWAMSMYVDPTHSSPARAEAYAGSTSNDPYVLRVTGARVIEVLRGTLVIGTLPMAAGDRTATARFGGSNAVIATETQQSAFPLADITATVYWVFVTANMGARVSNVSLSVVTGADPLIHPDDPNLIVDCSTTFVANGRSVLRSIEDTSARDVLDEISTALLLATHFDVTGRLVIRSSDRITAAGIARTLTLRDDIFDANWESNLLSHRSHVRVGADVPSINLSHDITWELDQGSETTMRNGDVIIDTFEPAADEEWLVSYPQEASESMAGTNALGQLSWAGASFTQDDGDSWRWGNDYFSFTYETPNHRTHTITQTASGIPLGGYLSTRATENSTTTVWRAWQGMALPLLRGSITKFYEGSVRLNAGPIGGRLSHEMQHWHDWRRHEVGSTVHTIAEHIKSYVSAPNPELKSIDIVPDPRLELADQLIADATEHGFTATGPCVGISESFGGSYEMTLDMRLTGLETTFQTLEAWNLSSPVPLTLAQFNDLAPTPMTLTEFNSDEEA